MNGQTCEPAVLAESQVSEFAETGCLTVTDAVGKDRIGAMNEDLHRWVEESRNHTGPYGKTVDGRPRFDVQPGHSADKPALRRIQSPTDIAPAFLDVLKESRMIDVVADLIGPDLRLHHSKVNCKLPGSETVVGWHQDFTFDPHSNDDMITCLVFLDDVTAENGPLMTVPGSHKGPLYTLWQEGRFTGEVAPDVARRCDAEAVEHVGPKGSVCFIHSRLLHGSTANLTSQSRNLFIAQIAAADAVPLTPNHIPSLHEGLLLRGREPNRIRSSAFEIDVPVVPETTFGHLEKPLPFGVMT